MPRDHSYECETCGEMRGGFDDLPCDCDIGPMALYLAMSMLAHNLAIGAALCEAHGLALDEAEQHRLYHEHGYRLSECWSPGCGKAAP